jgi:hypothetical protein
MAWRVPVADLAAWCPQCLDLARRESTHKRTATLEAELAADTLPLEVPGLAEHTTQAAALIRGAEAP